MTYLDDISEMIDLIQAQDEQLKAQKEEISKLRVKLRDVLRATGESNGAL